VPLIDLTPETGTTCLFPGSHVGPKTDDFELPYLKRGECFLMDYRLWHYGTANRSDAERPVLYIIYCRPWFTDYRNFKQQPRIRMDESDFLAVPREHRPLFRRLAGKGAFNRTEKELLDQ
jgi:ectoine hydroxylase-related dioxygenase (phytanoyl-CoA dioxygenase family)